MIFKFKASNGSFPEVGRVIHTDMQGGSSKGVALTAFVVTAFLEDQVSLYNIDCMAHVPTNNFQIPE